MFRLATQRIRKEAKSTKLTQERPPSKEVPHWLAMTGTWAGIVGGVFIPLALFLFTCNTSTKIEGMADLLIKQDSIQVSSNQVLQQLATQNEYQQRQIDELGVLVKGQEMQIEKMMDLVGVTQRQNKLITSQTSLLEHDSVERSEPFAYSLSASIKKIMNFFIAGETEARYAGIRNFPDTAAMERGRLELRDNLIKLLDSVQTNLMFCLENNPILQRNMGMRWRWNLITKIADGIYSEMKYTVEMPEYRKFKNEWDVMMMRDFLELGKDFGDYFVLHLNDLYKSDERKLPKTFRIIKRYKRSAGELDYTDLKER